MSIPTTAGGLVEGCQKMKIVSRSCPVHSMMGGLSSIIGGYVCLVTRRVDLIWLDRI